MQESTRTNRTVTVTIPNGQTNSSAWKNEQWISGLLIMPNVFNGASSIKFQASADGTTWVPLYDENNVEKSINVSASRAYPLPIELAGAPFARIVAASALTAAATITVCLTS
jgi:hypothetical protein